jgi:predicted alpha/beta superfamily hydrolase
MLRFMRRSRRAGTVRTLAGVHSPQLDNVRDLHVYLPPGYEETDQRYPVVYLQDGQNLFDDALSFSGAWKAAAAADASARLGYPAILVGISNIGSSRIDEYSPYHDSEIGAGGRGEAYLSFVIDTVKPLIDAELRTRPGRADTLIGGSSMGALIALHAFFRHPDVFGGASIQSPALWFANRAVLHDVADAEWHRGRIYLDVGRREGKTTLDNALSLRGELLLKGFVERRTFWWVEDPRGTHHESAWGRRLKKALPLLLAAEDR